MTTKDNDRSFQLEDGVFLALVILISAAFIWVTLPFFAAILWAVIATILFEPLQNYFLRKMPGKRNIAALSTLSIIIALVIVPAIFLVSALIEEAIFFYNKIQAGEINFLRMFARLEASLPDWAQHLLRQIDLNNLDSLQNLMTSAATSGIRTVATQTFVIGQSAFSFMLALGLMLYMTFFLLRDGAKLTDLIERAAPLRKPHRQELISRFVIVIRATIKGSLVVAVAQGLIGGIVFAFLGIPGALLWGVLMGFFSLIPAIGTGLIWVPVAIYLIVTGALVKGLILVFCGLFVIGMVDNILRPILVGRDTRIPDYVVLLTTLGGLELFGFNGIVIGPLIAALFMAVWQIVIEMRSEKERATVIISPAAPIQNIID